MSYHVSDPEAVATAISQIHKWIRESPANWDQILMHFAVLHAQVDAMHQAVHFLNQAAENNLATMTLLTYPLARSGVHIHQDRFICPLHDQPHLPTTGPHSDPPRSPPQPPALPQPIATTAPIQSDNDEPRPPTDIIPQPAFTPTTPAVIQITQTMMTTSPSLRIVHKTPLHHPHRASPHLSINTNRVEQIMQARSPSPPSYFCQRWDCHFHNKQTYLQVKTYAIDKGPNTPHVMIVNLCFRCNRECRHFVNGQRIYPYREWRIIQWRRPTP
ncbi:hypothetical protein AX16_010405 [Volvariella volvacea WC 439]|nr:hypothetical protein AX16_010405 [Volvariella volvacea WC 439]